MADHPYNCEYDEYTKSCKYCTKGMQHPELQRVCWGYQKPIPPSMPIKVVTFISKGISHLAHGAPKCTQEQIDERLKICLSCPSDGWEQYSVDYGSCKYCGCCGSRERTFLNKLNRADEQCPQLHWLACVDISQR